MMHFARSASGSAIWSPRITSTLSSIVGLFESDLLAVGSSCAIQLENSGTLQGLKFVWTSNHWAAMLRRGFSLMRVSHLDYFSIWKCLQCCKRAEYWGYTCSRFPFSTGELLGSKIWKFQLIALKLMDLIHSSGDPRVHSRTHSTRAHSVRIRSTETPARDHHEPCSTLAVVFDQNELASSPIGELAWGVSTFVISAKPTR